MGFFSKLFKKNKGQEAAGLAVENEVAEKVAVKEAAVETAAEAVAENVAETVIEEAAVEKVAEVIKEVAVEEAAEEIPQAVLDFEAGLSNLASGNLDEAKKFLTKALEGGVAEAQEVLDAVNNA